MQIQVQIFDEDRETLAQVLQAHSFENVDQLFHYALKRLATENETDFSDQELTDAALGGIASGWFEGDPFARARAILARGRAQQTNAA